MQKIGLITAALLASGTVSAEIIKIPQQSGFSGYVLGGVTFVDYESNLYKGPDGDKTIDSLGSPESQSATTPLINFDLRYTFADTRTQIVLGNQIQDALRYDFTQIFGVRQEISQYGIISGAYVFSAMPGEVWSDPFATGVKRDDTDRTSNGFRLGWEQVMGSNFAVMYTMRNIDIDHERSGNQLVAQGKIIEAERRTLDRNGDINSLEFSYNWMMAKGHILSPSITLTKADLDGDAVSYDGGSIQLSYGYHSPRWSLISNVFAGKRNYDERNPVFNRKADADEYGLGATFFWHNLMGVKDLSSQVTASFARSDSDINFYNAQASSLSLGLLYKF